MWRGHLAAQAPAMPQMQSMARGVDDRAPDAPHSKAHLEDPRRVHEAVAVKDGGTRRGHCRKPGRGRSDVLAATNCAEGHLRAARCSRERGQGEATWRHGQSTCARSHLHRGCGEVRRHGRDTFATRQPRAAGKVKWRGESQTRRQPPRSQAQTAARPAQAVRSDATFF